jgi:hypothetical protein
MHQRVRCPHCHRWTDALLVWAAGDCCPTCNAPIAGFSRPLDETDEEPLSRPTGRFSQSGLTRPKPERLSR